MLGVEKLNKEQNAQAKKSRKKSKEEAAISNMSVLVKKKLTELKNELRDEGSGHSVKHDHQTNVPNITHASNKETDKCKNLNASEDHLKEADALKSAKKHHKRRNHKREKNLNVNRENHPGLSNSQSVGGGGDALTKLPSSTNDCASKDEKSTASINKKNVEKSCMSSTTDEPMHNRRDDIIEKKDRFRKKSDNKKDSKPGNVTSILKSDRKDPDQKETQINDYSSTDKDGIFEENEIVTLQKVNPKHPLARYLCKLCDYHCDSMAVVERHVKGEVHVNKRNVKSVARTIKSLPAPCKDHEQALTNLLDKIHQEHHLTEQDLINRNAISCKLRKQLCEELTGCELQLYGSSATGLGLKSGDVNVHLHIPETANHADIMTKSFKLILADTESYTDVVSDFISKIPAIHFVDAKTNLRCSLNINNNLAVQTSKLIRLYKTLDSRFPVLCTAARYWAKICHIDEQSRGTLPSYSFILMMIHYLQQSTPPVLPVISTETLEQPSWKSVNRKSVGLLWLEYLKFYSVEFKVISSVVNIRQSNELTIQEKNWSTRFINIEDPYSMKRNVARAISHSLVYEYIKDRFKSSFLYFGVPQTEDGPIFDVLLSANDQLAGAIMKSQSKKRGTSNLENRLSSSKSSADNTGDSSKKSSQDLAACSGDSDDDDVNTETEVIVEGNDKETEVTTGDHQVKNHETSMDEIITIMKNVKLQELFYEFDTAILTGGKEPAIMCRLCQKKGHNDDDCPEEQLTEICKLPPMTPEFLQNVNEVCTSITDEHAINRMETYVRLSILSCLEKFICQTHPEAHLELFGSSINGFGFHNSDLDICLTFNGNETGKDLDFPKIVEELAKRLQEHKDLYNVTAIPTAKVPIVKFMVKRPQLEGDISLYNTLGLHNSRLLRTYCHIDMRLQCLGYTMKHFAKSCDIGAASRGSLSSYAYILMVIYFLQQRKPPVLPVLQELYEGDKKPEVLVDGWNAWFYNDLHNLHKDWDGYRKNVESVGELWRGLLEFYANEFDFKNYVIGIRRKEPLMRLEKLWNSKSLAIEDPFDTSHNLGAGVSRKMNTYILNAFIKGREVFGCPIRKLHRNYRHLKDYLFDPDILTDGILPPNSRGCYICGNIGHKVKECPKKMPKKNKFDDHINKSRDFNNKQREDKLDNAGYGRTNNCQQRIVQVNPCPNGPFNGAHNFMRNNQSILDPRLDIKRRLPPGFHNLRDNQPNKLESHQFLRKSQGIEVPDGHRGVPVNGRDTSANNQNRMNAPSYTLDSDESRASTKISELKSLLGIAPFPNGSNTQNKECNVQYHVPDLPMPPQPTLPLDDPAIVRCIPSKSAHLPASGNHDNIPYALNPNLFPNSCQQSQFYGLPPFQQFPLMARNQNNTTITPSPHGHAHIPHPHFVTGSDQYNQSHRSPIRHSPPRENNVGVKLISSDNPSKSASQHPTFNSPYPGTLMQNCPTADRQSDRTKREMMSHFQQNVAPDKRYGSVKIHDDAVNHQTSPLHLLRHPSDPSQNAWHQSPPVHHSPLSNDRMGFPLMASSQAVDREHNDRFNVFNSSPSSYVEAESADAQQQRLSSLRPQMYHH